MSMRVTILALLLAGLPLQGHAQAEQAESAAVTVPEKSGVVQLRVEGIDGEQHAAVIAALDIARYETRKVIGSARLQRLLQDARKQVAEALEPFGYYHATADVQHSALPERRHMVTIKVTRGEPVRVDLIDVAVDGDAGSAETIRKLVAAFEPAKGAVLDHRLYEASKAGIERGLLRLGYFDKQVLERRVEVTRASGLATIKVRWSSGPRYRFGATSFSGAQFSDEFLQHYIPWDPGEDYEQSRIEDLQNRLAVVGYFGGIEIEPQVEERTDGSVPVQITLTPAAQTAYSIGTYYETSYGAGVRLGLDRRWINADGHTARGELEFSQALQALTAEYRVPRASKKLGQWIGGVNFRNEDTADVNARTALLRAGVLGTWSSWTGVATLNALRSAYRVGTETELNPRRDATIIYPELAIGRVFATDRIRPRRGASIKVTARAASRSAGSDADLAQVQIVGRHVMPLGETGRLLSRVELGVTKTDNFDALPPDLRFFAGGQGSVRGYGWRDLGPRDAQGKALGGEKVLTFSLEYERNFLPDWSWATFVDGGNVFNDAQLDLRLGVGAGVRWSSPIGPIRFDLAHGLDSPDRSIQLHFSAGPDL